MLLENKKECELINRLPRVKGQLRANVDLSKLTWFRVGGPAEVMFWPYDLDDLSYLLKELPQDIPITIIGTGSNIIVRDGGVPGIVVRLNRTFNHISINNRIIKVGSGVSNLTLANFARDHNVTGLEFLYGIPGTVGGAIFMNAGCYGSEIKDVVKEIEVVNSQGNVSKLSSSEIEFGYRQSKLPDGLVVLGAELQVSSSNNILISKKMDLIRKERETSQPMKKATGGSTFTNPQGKKAWKLIHEAGCRGMSIGGASVSEKHCNFLINRGSASALDLENLGEEIRKRVFENSGIKLSWEIKRIGIGFNS